jgi:hypothetical protein
MRTRACCVVAISMAVAACAGPRPPPPGDPVAAYPMLTLSPGDLVRELTARSAAVRSLKGKLALDVLRSATDERRSCRAALAAQSPVTTGAGLYVKGTHGLVPTLFTLVSDGERFWLHVPRSNVLYTGPVVLGHSGEHPDVMLDPRDLFRSLFVEPLGPGVDVVEEPGGLWVVTETAGGKVRRRLWIERRGLTVQREVYFDGGGAEELVVERSRFRDLAGTLYPARITLREPATGAEAVLDFETLTLNPQDLAPGTFKPLVPPGARVEVISGERGGT